MTYQVAKNKHFGHVINGVLFFLKKRKKKHFFYYIGKQFVLEL